MPFQNNFGSGSSPGAVSVIYCEKKQEAIRMSNIDPRWGAWTKQHLSPQPETIGLEEDYENGFVRKQSNLITFEGKLLALWDGRRCLDSLSYRLPVDYLLVVGKQQPDVQSIVNSYDVKQLLIDGSVPRYLMTRWVAQADAAALPYYTIGDGALVLDKP